MNKQTEKVLRQWLELWPESLHPSAEKNFYHFISIADDNDDLNKIVFDKELIKRYCKDPDAFENIDAMVEIYKIRYSAIVDYLKYKKEEK